MLFHIQRFLILIFAVGLMIIPAAGSGEVFAQPHEHEKSAAAKYQCPMHPQVVSDKPGDCPICHMRLVPIRSASSKSTSQHKAVEGRVPVEISEDSRNRVGIRTETVQKRHLKTTVQAWGTVAHDPELYQLQIEFLREERLWYERQRDRTPVSRKRGLLDKEKVAIEFLHKGLSHDWVKALEAAGVPDERLIWHPDAKGAWIYIQLREKDSHWVRVGDKATITSPALPNLKLEGRIEFIDTLVNEETRTVRAHVLIPDLPAELRPNASVNATILVDLGTSEAVSEEAPLFMGDRTIVFVDEDGVFKPREVVLGPRVKGYYKVKSGLKENEKIAASGNFFIDSESRLQSSVAEASHGSHAS